MICPKAIQVPAEAIIMERFGREAIARQPCFHKFSVMPRLERGIQYAAAYRLNSNTSGILGRPV
ncbi:hypothetical protein XH92_08620 [Bradyrhizobium sp. CCBAU 53421]|nr:hypothetical protein XH92_08620 [Bradyrhizobium sp. CCBAU 53421]